jgi:hypothetical protein
MGVKDTNLVSPDWFRVKGQEVSMDVPVWKWLMGLDVYIRSLWEEARKDKLATM